MGLQQHLRSNPAEVKRLTAESPYRNAAILTNRFRDGDYAGIPGQYESDKDKDKKKKSYFITLLFSYLFLFILLAAVAVVASMHWESTIQPAFNNIVEKF